MKHAVLHPKDVTICLVKQRTAIFSVKRAPCQVHKYQHVISEHLPAATRSCPCRYINEVWQRYKKPIWMTEFACCTALGTASQDEKVATQIRFLRAAMHLMDSDPRVFRWEPRGLNNRPFADVVEAACVARWGATTTHALLPETKLAALGKLD